MRGQSRIRDTLEEDILASEKAKNIFLAASLDATVIITIVYKNMIQNRKEHPQKSQSIRKITK